MSKTAIVVFSDQKPAKKRLVAFSTPCSDTWLKEKEQDVALIFKAPERAGRATL